MFGRKKDNGEKRLFQGSVPLCDTWLRLPEPHRVTSKLLTSKQNSAFTSKAIMCTWFLYFTLTYISLCISSPHAPFHLHHFSSHYTDIRLNIRVTTFKRDALFGIFFFFLTVNCVKLRFALKLSCTQTGCYFFNSFEVLYQQGERIYGPFIALLCRMGDKRGLKMGVMGVMRIIRFL